MVTILGKKADVHLITISACHEQVVTDLIMPEGAYEEALSELKKDFSDDEIYGALKTMRELEKEREQLISPYIRYRL